MAQVVTLEEDLWGYCELSFIMARVGNLDTNLGGYCKIFGNGRGG